MGLLAQNTPLLGSKWTKCPKPPEPGGGTRGVPRGTFPPPNPSFGSFDQNPGFDQNYPSGGPKSTPPSQGSQNQVFHETGGFGENPGFDPPYPRNPPPPPEPGGGTPWGPRGYFRTPNPGFDGFDQNPGFDQNHPSGGPKSTPPSRGSQTRVFMKLGVLVKPPVLTPTPPPPPNWGWVPRVGYLGGTRGTTPRNPMGPQTRETPVFRESMGFHETQGFDQPPDHFDPPYIYMIGAYHIGIGG